MWSSVAHGSWENLLRSRRQENWFNEYMYISDCPTLSPRIILSVDLQNLMIRSHRLISGETRIPGLSGYNHLDFSNCQFWQTEFKAIKWCKLSVTKLSIILMSKRQKLDRHYKTNKMVHETIFENVFLLIPWNLPYGTIPLTRALINKLFYDFL